MEGCVILNVFLLFNIYDKFIDEMPENPLSLLCSKEEWEIQQLTWV